MNTEGTENISIEPIFGTELEKIDAENISIEPILGTELEGIETTKYPLITSSIELSVGTRFNSWEIAEYYLKEHGRQNGFVIKRYRVEYNKNHTVKRRALTCKNAGKYKPNKTKSIEQQCNKGSKKRVVNGMLILAILIMEIIFI
jgi:hypothetical protein